MFLENEKYSIYQKKNGLNMPHTWYVDPWNQNKNHPLLFDDHHHLIQYKKGIEIMFVVLHWNSNIFFISIYCIMLCSDVSHPHL